MAIVKRYVTYKQFQEHDFEITSKINVFKNKKMEEAKEKIKKAREAILPSSSCVPPVDISEKEHSIRGAFVSVQRSHKNLHELLRSNSWCFFITLTFDKDKVDRLNDEACRQQFAKWRKFIKRKFTDMIYLAVPEYHKQGGLHYHIVVGSVTAEQLGLSDSGRVLHYGKAWKREDFENRGFKYDESTGEGFPIYNVSNWLVGYSTATEVRSTEAVTNYVSKYITKNDIDPRFFGKCRYHCSQNLNKPKVLRDEYILQDDLDLKHTSERFQRKVIFNSDEDIESCGGVLQYSDSEKSYDKYSVDLSKEEIIKLRLAGILPRPCHSVPFDEE